MLLPEPIPFRKSKPIKRPAAPKDAKGATETYTKTNFPPVFIPPFYTHIAARRNCAMH